MLSEIILLGRATRDPEVTQTRSGTKFTKLDVAVNKGYGEKEHANFYSCWFKEDLGDRLVKAGVKKGSLVYVVGDQDVKTYTKQDGTQGLAININATEWGYASSGKAKTDGNAPTHNQQSAPTQPYNPYANANSHGAPQFETVTDDDELPF